MKIINKGPLRFVPQINGTPKVQGVWTLKVQEGFPLDMSCQCARERGFEIDWVEVLADACKRREFSSLEKEIELLLESREGYLSRDDWNHVCLLFSGGLQTHKTEDDLYSHIWRDRESLTDLTPLE